MNRNLPPYYLLSPEVAKARVANHPLVALESAVITHGLPFPENLFIAKAMEEEVRGQGAVPIILAVIDGKLCLGLTEIQLDRLVHGKGLMKISSRDLATAIVQGQTGGTTVAGTMVGAYKAGIQVFATGGIGGVHRQLSREHGTSNDISADLMQLAHTPMIVVCAGAKAILDLPATLEALETLEVPVIGYQSSDFPAFYSRSSGLKTSSQADSPEQVVEIARKHWELGTESAVLVTVPPDEKSALPFAEVDKIIQEALEVAQAEGVHGQAVTPLLLAKVASLSQGKTLRTNLALLQNNARVAGMIARAFTPA